MSIVVREGHGYLADVPPEVEAKLVDATSFRPVGYQYTTAFRKRGDGRTKLLRHSRFPAGLLGRVIGVLDKHGVEHAVDSEVAVDNKPELGLRTVGLESRWYQDDALEAALLHPRGVIRAPTGSGKTAIITRLIATRARHAFVVVPTIDLLHQTRRFLAEHLVWGPDGEMPGCHVEIGQMGDGVVDPRPVTVATIRTAAKALGMAYESYEYGEYDDKDSTDVDPKALKAFFDRVGLVIVDEAHILGADMVFGVATKIPAPNKWGFSASPWRDDGADLMIEAATGPVVYQIETKTLVDGGFLVPPVIQVVSTRGWWKPAAWGQVCTRCDRQRGWDLLDNGTRRRQMTCQCGGQKWRSEFQQAYKAEIVENNVRNWRIAEIVQGKDPLVGPMPGATLLLVKQVNHGRTLEQLIPGSVFLSGKDKSDDRIRAYNAIRTGVTRVLVATTIADLGLDLPALRNLVLAAGGKSSTRHLQRIGRVARPYEGKPFARVVDFDDGHVHKWFDEQAKARRKVEKAEWGSCAIWL